jgi:vitamin B12 transporter
VHRAVLCSSQDKADSLLKHVTLGEVEIVSASRERTSVEHLSLTDAHGFAAHDLGYYFDRKGLAQINTNGPSGMAASIRLRGTSSDHTTIHWQGLPINAVSLGMTDLSLVPVFLFDHALLDMSPNTAQVSGNNLGSVIALENSQQQEGWNVRLLSTYNSLNNSTYGADVFYSKQILEREGHRPKHRIIATRTKAFYQNILNDFDYNDKYQIGAPRIRQEHNDGYNRGLTQELRYGWSKYTLEANAWYQKRDMLLPSIMGRTLQGTSEQMDEFLRTSLGLKSTSDKLKWSVTTAWLDEYQLFRDNPRQDDTWGIHSRLKSKSWFNQLHASYQFRERWTFQVNALSSYHIVENVNYSNGKEKLWWGQTGLSIQYRFRRHSFYGDVRKDLRDVKTQPAGTLGHRLTYTKNKLKFGSDLQVAYKFRVADFNERFWVPGGNKDLKPESGWMYKAGAFIEYTSSKFSMSFNPSVYYHDIENWIQWVPQTAAYWIPMNYKQVRTWGGEAPLRLAYTSSPNFSTSLDARYVYTLSEAVNNSHWNNEQSFEMIYTPRHVVAAGWHMSYKKISSSVDYKWTSLRYTDEQNYMMRALPSYALLGMRISYELKFAQCTLEVGVGVDNALNETYESVRSYAMPGRVYSVQLQIQFNDKRNKSKHE